MNEAKERLANGSGEGNHPEMGGEPKTKRGLFAPIMLVLLVLSAMGNVVLYTFHLQDGKDKREAEGAAIFNDIRAAAVAAAAAADGLAALPDAGIGDRFRLKTNLERELTLGGLGMARLVPAADGRGREAMDAELRDEATTFFERSSRELLAIGAHDGPLTAEERALVERLQTAFSELADQASGIALPGELTDLAAMQLAAGGSWVDAVYAMAERMAEFDFPSAD